MTDPKSPLSSTPEIQSNVYRVAITGGPCAGKTTALAEVSERLRSRGFNVYVVPEAATLMFTGGASFAGMTSEQVFNFQTQLLKTQIALEDAFAALGRASGKQCFVLCDRGACDGRAYMPQDLWVRMLDENGWDMVGIRDGRYDLVVHLVTAADGAEAFYSLENNKTRTETPPEAVKVDMKTRNAWVGHPHLRIVDNRTGFREKINRVDARISELAGIHMQKRVVRKFLLRDIERELAERGEHFSVEQTFLTRGLGDDVQESVRRRGKDRNFTFVHKVRSGGSETKRQITNREYLSLLAHCDPDRRTVRIRRQCFLHDGVYFVLDCVTNVEPGIQMLRCHCEVGDDGITLPKWLSVEREVTGEREFSMHNISLRIAPTRVRTKEVPIREQLSKAEVSFAKSF